MSKIQKALDAIASQRKAESDTPKKAERYLKRFGPNVNLNPEVVPGTTEVPEAPLFKHNPGTEISVDIDRLIDAGVWRTGEEDAVIREQFRRAKRPVIANAFANDELEGDFKNVVLVTSALPGAGKTFCATNLARSVSRERDVGVVLVDGDVLKSGITDAFDLRDRRGLVDYLHNDSVTVSDIVFKTDLNDIYVVPSGERHAESAELLASQRMGALMRSLSSSFPHCLIIVDTPPMLVTNEAHILSGYAGQVVLIIAARKTPQAAVVQALGSLDRRKPINAILNKSPAAAATGATGDSYGYYPFQGDANEH